MERDTVERSNDLNMVDYSTDWATLALDRLGHTSLHCNNHTCSMYYMRYRTTCYYTASYGLMIGRVNCTVQ